MVIDASALCEIIGGAPSAERFATLILNSESVMSAYSVLDARIVLSRYLREETDRVVSRTLSLLGVSVLPFGLEDAQQAALTFDQYGIGRHAAALTVAECAAYTLAKVSGQPLLYAAGRFDNTDIPTATKRRR